MSHPMNAAIEMAMQAADRSDEFKNLPGAGKPLTFLHQPKDAVLDHLLKENQAKPLAVELKRQIATLHATLKATTDPEDRKAVMKQIADKQLRLDLELEALRKYG